jgi:hypothetical protein
LAPENALLLGVGGELLSASLQVALAQQTAGRAGEARKEKKLVQRQAGVR